MFQTLSLNSVRRIDNPRSASGQLCRSLWLSLFMFLLCLGVPITAHAQDGDGSVRGTVYNDANNNGRLDLGEPGRPGLSVMAVGNGQTFGAVTSTDGRYSLNGLPPGRYLVSGPTIEGLVPTGREAFVNVASGQIAIGPDFGYEESCAKIVVKKIIWLKDPQGCFKMTFCVTNLSNYPIGHIFTLNNPPIVVQSPLTLSPNYIPVSPALAPGATATFTVTVCGVPPNSNWTLNLALHDPELRLCCNAKVDIKVPPCDCFQILDESIVCNPDGTVTWCATFQSLVPTPIFWMLIAPPPGITINPTVTSLPAVPMWGTWTVCITITGATPGAPLTLPIIIRDRFNECCRKDIVIDIPLCNCLQDAQCMDKAPLYSDDKIPTSTGAFGNYATLFPGTVSVITCCVASGTINNVNTLDLPAVAVHNLKDYQTTAVPLGADWVPPGFPRGYSGVVSGAEPMGAWTVRKLGSVFGVTLDKYGNIFVTHTSAYNEDFLGSVGANQPGWIYMIKNGTGQMFPYCKLPNVLDASAPLVNNSSYYPGLGNISYDGNHDQFFVTNMEDGKIYRVAGTGGVNTSGAIVGAPYDPILASAGFTADNGSAGMVNVGDRLWGVQYHRDRVYFSRWRVDMNNPSATDFNEIWSIDVNAGSGAFGASLQKEITVPHFASELYSAPVSDLSFSKEGKMMLAERGASYGQPSWSGTSNPHGARGLEYTCDAGTWIPTGKQYDVGASNNSNGAITNGWQSSSGGVDYDQSTATNVSIPTAGARVWFTVNGWYVASAGQLIYGIQGFLPSTGGNSTNTIYNDADGDLSSTPKTYIGDVEIPCPSPGVAGNVRMLGLIPNPSGRTITVQAFATGSSNLAAIAQVTLDASGNFNAPLDLMPGTYRVTVKSKCFLRHALLNVQPGAMGLQFDLLAGDIDGDNIVSILDYLLLSGNFGKSSADSDWMTPGANGIPPMECDIDGDGSVSILDYLLISENFGISGD